MAIFFKPYLRKKLLQRGWKQTADCLVPDIKGDVRQMEVKMEELERFLAKQKLPRLKDVTPELTASEVHISDDNVLGTGGYGAVYKGEHGGNAVAVKAMFGSGDSKMKIPQSASNMMRREAMIMCSLNHPNILRIVGIVPARGWIVMELCARVPQHRFGTQRSFSRTGWFARKTAATIMALYTGTRTTDTASSPTERRSTTSEL